VHIIARTTSKELVKSIKVKSPTNYCGAFLFLKAAGF
jgi:hypothetical protein